MLKTYFYLVTLLCVSGITAQNNQWTLERSVQYAMENNLQIKQLKNQQQLADLTLKGNKLSRLPNVSGSSSLGTQFGRTIDPTTNAFEQQSISFNSFQLQANVTIFGGNRIKNSIYQAQLDKSAAELETEDVANDVALSVANSYLTVLLTREQLVNARAQLQLTTDQLRQTDAGISAGALPESQRFDLVAQQAANQQSVVELENQVQLSLMSLQLLLELDLSSDFNIITPDLDITQADLVENFSFNEVYSSAATTQPTLRAADLRVNSAVMGREVAKSGFYPTLSAFGSMNTNYSTAGKEVNDDNVTFVPSDPIPVLINEVPVQLQNFVPEGIVVSDQAYLDQLNQNFGQSIGLSLNVPIYSQGRNKIAVQRAEILKLNAEVQYQQSVNQLQNEVQTALTNWRGARQAYQAAETSLEAAQRAYDVAKRRYDLGASDNLLLLTATNRLEQSRVDFTRAKFQLIFNRQVIQFYLGNPLTLNK